ncbi:response regulator transcription factor [Nocardia sp. NPDC051030]|uniref:response regulator transcription factor n=1 Tax=Nocardia sp. NPDC051030 TaxID=3155162 RepID=UPI00341AE990
MENNDTERAALTQKLIRQGHTVMSAADGEAAIDASGDADVILLDLELPDLDGLEVCRSIRAMTDTPIIVVTERASELDCVLGLQAGADDYIGKPYGFQELIARMNAVLRRSQPASRSTAGVIEVGGLRIDPHTREITLRGRHVSTTRKEFELLSILAEHPGAVVSRADIMHRVWGDSWSRRTVDTHVSSLRGKLGDTDWIVAVRGVGFKLGTPGIRS